MCMIVKIASMDRNCIGCTHLLLAGVIGLEGGAEFIWHCRMALFTTNLGEDTSENGDS